MKKITLIFLLSIFFSVGANAGADGDNSLLSKNQPESVNDCFEKVNRGIFAFNQALDKTIFEPVAKGYRYIPSPIRGGTSNALTNLSNLITVPNNLLQGDIKTAGVNTVRFVVNTTVGILGIFDPAAALGFEKEEKEDYGQTLGRWGVGPGCYVVLPIFGPSTARDAVGTVANFVGGDPWFNVTVVNDTTYFNEADYYGTRVTSGIDFRAKNIDSFDSLEKNSIDFYASIRSLYLQDRQQKILNSEKITDTMDDSNWEEIETN
jgi:phospholipid-binding lipoprotein MlaA